MFAKTVQGPVDRHIAGLVDAINSGRSRVRTFACCSGHMVKPGVPYVAFAGTDWPFIRSLLTIVTKVNAVTRGSTRLELFEVEGRQFRGALRLTVYPWIELSEDEWISAFVDHTASPPRRLVRLWWDELTELARMVGTQDPTPCDGFELRFERAQVRFGDRSDES